ncbi:hypothetical protein V5O48_001527 [Marasmius crinis-equi]|uniref:Protein kinase regulator n=1 Tax=Marasmius crinis-equi TaxID=585013 RepID=A0ABR3FYN7_9AGAR
MDHATSSERSLMDWDEDEVQDWLAGLGFPQYEANIKEHRISGDLLCIMDQETLKGVGVATIGQRLSILKAVYNLKVANNIPIEPDSYIPPSEAQDREEDLTLLKLNNVLSDQARRLRVLEEENKNLNSTLQSFLDDYNALRAQFTRNGTDDTTPPLRRQPSFKWAQYVKPTKSPTKPESSESPHPSPQQLEHDIPPYTRGNPQSQISSTPTPTLAAEKTPRPNPPPPTSVTDSPNPSSVLSPPKPSRQDSTDNLKSFKVSLEDPTYKVLPAALKKYRINNDNWENYAMFICYGSPGNRIERCLSYDEKPLLLFQKLKDAKKNPVFMLKHIKDIRSPIVVAQQKHAARKASSTISNSGDATPGTGAAATGGEKGSGTSGHTKNAPSRTITRPPKLEVHDLSRNANVPSGLMSGVSPQPGWPEPPGVSSPSVENQPQMGIPGTHLPSSSPIPPIHTPSSLSHTASTPLTSSTGVSASSTREIPSSSPGSISYAIAIYPYMAEQADEFDVVVGDTFIILSRARGWWVVQRDPKGTGVVEADISRQGWVPAGCLLETNQPVAGAIKEAREKKGMGNEEVGEAVEGGEDGEQPIAASSSKTPILPLSIISTSFPGIALMDYKKKGEEELDLVKDDSLRVFKRYNHWSYAVKEDGGDRGWVPSWFIGKVANANAAAGAGNQPTPPTPSVPSHNQQHTGQGSGNGAEESPWNGNQAQVSPMSSAFPTR